MIIVWLAQNVKEMRTERCRGGALPSDTSGPAGSRGGTGGTDPTDLYSLTDGDKKYKKETITHHAAHSLFYVEHVRQCAM